MIRDDLPTDLAGLYGDLAGIQIEVQFALMADPASGPLNELAKHIETASEQLWYAAQGAGRVVFGGIQAGQAGRTLPEPPKTP